MKKNTASLVLAIIGAILGLIGGIMWAACGKREGADSEIRKKRGARRGETPPPLFFFRANTDLTGN